MTNKPLEAAQKYLARGWKVLPVAPQQKGTHISEWQDLRLTEDELEHYFKPDSNIGILLGECSGDLTDIDCDTPEAIKCAHRLLPSTLLSGRGSNISHFWYTSPGVKSQKFKDLDGSVLLEIRHDLHQTVVEPSIHPSGDKYRWVNEREPREVEAPKLYDLCHKVAAATLIGRHLPVGGRHDIALALAGWLLKNLDEYEVLEILEAAWTTQNVGSDAIKDLHSIVSDTKEKLDLGDPITGKRTLDEYLPGLSQRISQWFGWKGEPSDATARTDYGNGQRFVARYGGDVKYVWEWKKWAFWNGKRWEKDEIGYVKHLATEAVRSLYLEAAVAPSDEGARLAKHALGSLQHGKVEAMLKMAASEPGMTISADRFDSNDHLLNCENGTLDLTSGKLLPHDKQDFITRLVPVPYRPAAKASRFRSFMEEILPDPDTRDFVHKAIGYSLTGDVSERSLFIAQGPGNNGKSTLLNACADVLGDYAARANAEVFLEKPAGSIPNDVAQLKGPRLVLASEVENGKRLSEAQVKNFTGGSDKLVGRFLYGEHFEFYPKFTAWILTNPLPRIKGTDPAIWNRLRIIPFHTVPAKIDLKLPKVLQREAEGILSWMVEGYQMYRKDGLKSPVEVETMKNHYRIDQDVIARFVAETCERGSEYSELLDKLFAEFKEWAVDSEEWKISKNRFSSRLDDLGCDTLVTGRKTYKTAIRFREDGEGGDGPDGHTPPEVGAGARLTPKGPLSATDRSEGTISDHKSSDESTTVGQEPDSVDEATVPDKVAGGVLEDAPVQHGAVVADVASIRDSDPGHLDVWAIDTETTGLDPRSSKLRVLATANPARGDVGEPQAFDLDQEYDLAESHLRGILDSGAPVVFHNGAFDLAFLEQRFPGVIEALDGRVYDTMILSQLAYAGRAVPPLVGFRTGHSLEACLERELGIHIDKSEQTSDWGGTLTRGQLEYAARDTEHLPALLVALAGKCESVGVSDRIVSLEMDLTPHLVKMRDRGIRVDVEGWRRKAIESQETVVGCEVLLVERLTELVDEDFAEDLPELNWGSPKQIQFAFAEAGVLLEDTKDSTLANSDDEYGLFDLLRQHRKASKLASSYGIKWLEHVDQDGFIHPEWKQTSTETGRMACANPNVQQIPRDEDFRSLFTARDGYKFVVSDYSQIELRIAAKIAKDPVMLEAYQRGDDIHTLTAAAITGKADPTKDDRQLAKAVNFGLLYGMGAEKLRTYAKTEYGVTLSDKEAKVYRNRWLDTYQFIRSWHRREGSKLNSARSGQHGETLSIKTLSGRVRGNVDLYTERLNTPVQGSGADGIKAALLEVARRDSFHPVAVVHDELVVEVPADGNEEQYQQQIEKIMVEQMEAMINVKGDPVPVAVEGKLTSRWEK